jgi:hypothetical protein
MTSDRPPFGKTWSRVSLIRTLTGAKVRRDMLRAAVKLTKPVLKLGKAVPTLTWREKTGTVIKREQVWDTVPTRAYDQIAPG